MELIFQNSYFFMEAINSEHIEAFMSIENFYEN